MATGGHQLGIDFGTSNTVAVLRWPDGRARPLLFDGVPLLPSAVFLDTDDNMLVGREAMHAARTRPEAFEPNPKRRIDEGTVLLGTRELTIVQLFAAVLARVNEEAGRVSAAAAGTTLTCPAGWGPHRRQILVDAAVRAGLTGPAGAGAPRLADEPVAAASYFTAVHGSRLPVGALAVVYDLGAGTFDASVVRRTPTGFEVLASEGVTDAGGLDIDAAIIAYFGSLYGQRNPAAWQRLAAPHSSADRRSHRLLWDDVRGAKETLSRASSTLVPIPLLDEDAPLGREQLERLARTILDRTIHTTIAALRAARVGGGDLAEVYLVGGSSRMPLVATLLHQALGIAPTAIEQPEMVVAEGSLFVAPLPGAPPAAPATPMAAQAVGIAAVPPTSGSPFGSPVSGPPVSGPPYVDAWPTDTTWPPAEPAAAAAAATAAAAPAAGAGAAPPAAPTAHAPAPQPPAPQPPTGQPPAADGPNYQAILLVTAALAAAVAALLIASSDAAPAVFGTGVRAPLVHPALALLPGLLVVLLGSPGGGGWRTDPVLPRAAMLIAGYAAGITLTLPLSIPDEGEDAYATLEGSKPVLATAAGIAFIVAGISLARRGARGGRGTPTGRPEGGGRGRWPALLAGLGFAFSSLAYTGLGVNLSQFVLDTTFRYYEIVDGTGLYVAFLLGFTVSVLTGALLVVLLRATARARELAGSSTVALVGGVLLAMGGAFATYVGAGAVVFVADYDSYWEHDLARFRGAEGYEWFASLDGPAVPWLVGAVFVALLVAVLLQGRRRRDGGSAPPPQAGRQGSGS